MKDVIKAWRSIQTQYKRRQRVRKAATVSTATDEDVPELKRYKKPWIFYDDMSFLDGTFSQQKRMSNKPILQVVEVDDHTYVDDYLPPCDDDVLPIESHSTPQTYEPIDVDPVEFPTPPLRSLFYIFF